MTHWSCILNNRWLLSLSEWRIRKPGFDSINFSKLRKDITKLISVHDSIISLLLFGTLFIHIWPWMAAQQSILSNISKLVLSKLALFVLHNGICGSFQNEATINASALLCVLRQNLDEDSFDMLYENYCWAAISHQIWTTNVPYERKIDMLSSTDNNFMICLFDFERFSIEPRYPFFVTHTVYTTYTVCPKHIQSDFQHQQRSKMWMNLNIA